MKYVSFENALEVQVGGHFYHFSVGSYNVEDELADIVVSNYHDRGVSYGTLPSTTEAGDMPLAAPAPEPMPEPEPEPGPGDEPAPEPA